MNPEEIGKRVKAKYPQYQNMSDSEVGKRVMEKYPQYGGQQPEQQKGEGLLHQLLVQPYETTLGNIGALGQVGLSALVGKFNPQLGAQLAQEGAFGGNVNNAVQEASVGNKTGAEALLSGQGLKTMGKQALASAEIYGHAMGLKALTSPKALSTVKSVASKGKDVVKTVANPKKAVVDARNTAAIGKKINKTKIIKEADKIVLDNPGAQREFTNVIKPQLEKIKDANDLLRKIDRWNKKAFLKGGGMKSSHAADLYGDILNLLRGELKRVAPKAAKYQNILRLSHTVPKAVGKTTWTAVKWAGLAKLLGL